MKQKKLIRYILIGIVAVLLARLLFPRKAAPDNLPRDYAEIAEEGTLRATTEYNSIGFHVDGDTLTGFHYELIEAFARDHGLQLELTPEMSLDTQMKGLAEGRYDVIADGLLVTTELRDSLLLTTPILLSRQVLVQRRADTPEDSATFISSQLDLAEKTLHVVKGSHSILRIRNLSSEIGDTIYIKEMERYGAEQLISLVAHGDIDYAVCDERIARAAADSLPQIDISTAISFTQFRSWAVGKRSPTLLDSLDTYLQTFQQTKAYKEIYNRYYK